jgi:hypothetical protein
LVYSPGRDDDVLDDSRAAGSVSIATDGVYAWPRTLVHYVRTYEVELPSEFEAHMERQGWIPRNDVDKSSVELPRY